MHQHDKQLLTIASAVYLENLNDAERQATEVDPEGLVVDWNPLTSDTDALDLATRLRLFRGWSHYLSKELDRLGENTPSHTRRAITRAACVVHRPRAMQGVA